MCLVKLPGQVKGLFQRELQVEEEIVGFWSSPDSKGLALQEKGLTCYGRKGVAT